MKISLFDIQIQALPSWRGLILITEFVWIPLMKITPAVEQDHDDRNKDPRAQIPAP
jgi:hypothetical protein